MEGTHTLFACVSRATQGKKKAEVSLQTLASISVGASDVIDDLCMRVCAFAQVCMCVCVCVDRACMRVRVREKTGGVAHEIGDDDGETVG